jgi:hypothetical protein
MHGIRGAPLARSPGCHSRRGAERGPERNLAAGARRKDLLSGRVPHTTEASCRVRVASTIGEVPCARDVGPRAFDGARTIGSTAIPRALPRSGGAARSARCTRRVRSPQASCGLRHLRRAAPASIGPTATARVTVGTATRLRAPATWPSCQTRAASRPRVARVAHPVRELRTSSAASFSAGACPWEADPTPRCSSVVPSACRWCRRRPGLGRVATSSSAATTGRAHTPSR